MKDAKTRDRTGDLQIFSLTLSQLSYRGDAPNELQNSRPKRAPGAVVLTKTVAGPPPSMLSYLILAYLILSYPILAYLILSYHILAYLILY